MLRCPHYGGRISMLTLFSYSLNWEFENEQGTYGSPGYAFTNSIPDQNSLHSGKKHTLAFYTKCVTPVRQRAAFFVVLF